MSKAKPKKEEEVIEHPPPAVDLPPPKECDSFIITPSLVNSLWHASRPIENLIELYQKTFNPENRIDDEKLDYNELKIISDFQVYNLIFAKKELLLDDEKTSYLLEVFWTLLGIMRNGEKVDSIKAADNFNQALELKYKNFQGMLVQRVKEGMFSTVQLKQIVEYAKNGYFKHFRLFDFVLNNKQLCEIKKISIYQETPMFSPPLSEAMEIKPDQPL